MIKAEIVGVERVVTNLESVTSTVRAALAKVIKEQGIRLSSYIKEKKLSGQVLNVRTGTLRRSVISEFSDDGDKISAVIGPGPLKYAKVHEFGGTFQRTYKNGTTSTVTYPERSYLRSSLKDLKDDIRKKMLEAVRDGVRK